VYTVAVAITEIVAAVMEASELRFKASPMLPRRAGQTPHRVPQSPSKYMKPWHQRPVSTSRLLRNCQCQLDRRATKCARPSFLQLGLALLLLFTMAIALVEFAPGQFAQFPAAAVRSERSSQYRSDHHLSLQSPRMPLNNSKPLNPAFLGVDPLKEPQEKMAACRAGGDTDAECKRYLAQFDRAWKRLGPQSRPGELGGEPWARHQKVHGNGMFIGSASHDRKDGHGPQPYDSEQSGFRIAGLSPDRGKSLPVPFARRIAA